MGETVLNAHDLCISQRKQIYIKKAPNSHVSTFCNELLPRTLAKDTCEAVVGIPVLECPDASWRPMQTYAA
jgi:hypothetical protein